ncbi:MAG TPA: spore coat protein [Firmicutes bacterium]|nr:spore coat protein [Bacillota bacterium]
MQLTQKESMLLKDMLRHEELCIQKYGNYAQQVKDPQLKQLFSQYQSNEQQHYNTVNQLLQGQVPNTGAGGGSQQQSGQMSQGGQQLSQPGGQMSQMTQQQAGRQAIGAGGNQLQWQTSQQALGGMVNQNDASLCADALTTEKYIASAYNTAIFETVKPQIRQALQHIQQEEQQHGEGIANYMITHGMYQVQ